MFQSLFLDLNTAVRARSYSHDCSRTTSVAFFDSINLGFNIAIVGRWNKLSPMAEIHESGLAEDPKSPDARIVLG